GNMEIQLDRALFQKRIYPAIDIRRSNTRKEELLVDDTELQRIWLMRKALSDLDSAEAMELLIDRMKKTKTNKEFLETLSKI
ncbi:MAG: transcription termination factor Rho, partial [Candidatus Omnitrophota bacterium]